MFEIAAGTTTVQVLANITSSLSSQDGYDLIVDGADNLFTIGDAGLLEIANGSGAVTRIGNGADRQRLAALGDTLYAEGGGTIFKITGTGFVPVTTTPEPAGLLLAVPALLRRCR